VQEAYRHCANFFFPNLARRLGVTHQFQRERDLIRSRYRNPEQLLATMGDWLLMQGSQLARTVHLQYLDTRFLLDRSGKILDVTVGSDVDAAYLDRLRAKVAL